MGYFRDVLAALRTSSNDQDLNDLMDRRDFESQRRIAELANSKTARELASMLTAERARLPELLDAGIDEDVDNSSRLVGDIMAAQEQQARMGM